MHTAETRAEVNAIDWWHRIDLGGGLVTPGRDDSPKKLACLDFPSDLQGKSVLDVGAWDGFFSFESERRGASRVLAVDTEHSWGQEGWGTKQRGFNLARRILNSKVEDRMADVYDLSPERDGTFDLVLFLGVLYHLRHPLLALDKLAAVTKDQLILETFVQNAWSRSTSATFYPERGFLDEKEVSWVKRQTPWLAWGPTPAAVRAMLLSAGFRKVTCVRLYPQVLGSFALYSTLRSLYRQVRSGWPFWTTLGQGRAVFHAWK